MLVVCWVGEDRLLNGITSSAVLLLAMVLRFEGMEGGRRSRGLFARFGVFGLCGGGGEGDRLRAFDAVVGDLTDFLDMDSGMLGRGGVDGVMVFVKLDWAMRFGFDDLRRMRGGDESRGRETESPEEAVDGSSTMNSANSERESTRRSGVFVAILSLDEASAPRILP